VPEHRFDTRSPGASFEHPGVHPATVVSWWSAREEGGPESVAPGVYRHLLDAPGRYRIRAQLAGVGTLEDVADVREGDPETELELTLPAGRIVRVVAHRPEDTPGVWIPDDDEFREMGGLVAWPGADATSDGSPNLRILLRPEDDGSRLAGELYISWNHALVHAGILGVPGTHDDRHDTVQLPIPTGPPYEVEVPYPTYRADEDWAEVGFRLLANGAPLRLPGMEMYLRREKSPHQVAGYRRIVLITDSAGEATRRLPPGSYTLYPDSRIWSGVGGAVGRERDFKVGSRPVRIAVEANEPVPTGK
jgi:hypothetical protein